jgi:hypothetical protein
MVSLGGVSTHVVAALRDARFPRFGETRLHEINFASKN